MVRIARARRARAEAEAEPEPASMSLGEVGSQAWENLGPSAKQYGSDWVSTFTDPVGTAKGLGKTVVGGIQKAKDWAGIPTMNVFGDQRASAEAMGEFVADRFGGWENIKQTIATDPVGAVADIATIMSGGALAGARLPGVAGQVARVSGTVGNALDPASVAARGVGILGKKIAAPIATGLLGMTTGAGPTAIRTAASAGVAGGDLGTKFRAAMRGQMPMEEVVNSAKGAVDNLYQRRSDTYKKGMAEAFSGVPKPKKPAPQGPVSPAPGADYWTPPSQMQDLRVAASTTMFEWTTAKPNAGCR